MSLIPKKGTVYVVDDDEAVRRARRGLVVVGNLWAEEDRRAAVWLSERLGWPLCADVQSGLQGRGGVRRGAVRAAVGLPAMSTFFLSDFLADAKQRCASLPSPPLPPSPPPPLPAASPLSTPPIPTSTTSSSLEGASA